MKGTSSAEAQAIGNSYCCLPSCGRSVSPRFTIPICTNHAFEIHREARAVLNEAHLDTGMLPYQGDRVPDTLGRIDAEQVKRDTGSVVYYVRLGALIKIGTSRALRQRVRTLKSSQPDVELLATEPGGHDQERVRHAQFKAYRLPRSELFTPVPVLQDHVRQIQRRFGKPELAI